MRCIDENGNQIGVIPTRDALARAQQAGCDLVEISPNASPPVCRIMDFGKFKYEQSKKDKLSKRHQSATRVKEIQFHPNVGDHDYETKIRHAREFIEDGHRVKISLFFRGRESAHQELGFAVMNRVIKDVQDIAVAEQTPKLLGRNIIMLISPRPGLKQRQKQAQAAASEEDQPPAAVPDNSSAPRPG